MYILNFHAKAPDSNSEYENDCVVNILILWMLYIYDTGLYIPYTETSIYSFKSFIIK